MNIVLWILARLKEPSSWGGLSVILAMLGVNLPPGGVDAIVQLLASVAAAVAVFVPESGLTAVQNQVVKNPGEHDDGGAFGA